MRSLNRSFFTTVAFLAALSPPVLVVKEEGQHIGRQPCCSWVVFAASRSLKRYLERTAPLSVVIFCDIVSEPWGHSSVGRAIGSQSIGRRFESGCLQNDSKKNLAAGRGFLHILPKNQSFTDQFFKGRFCLSLKAPARIIIQSTKIQIAVAIMGIREMNTPTKTASAASGLSTFESTKYSKLQKYTMKLLTIRSN